MAFSIIQTSFGDGVFSNPYAIASISVVVILFSLVLAYPDRLVGTAARKEINVGPEAYPLIGNTTWLLRIVLKQRKILDEILRAQKEFGPGGQPVTMTFPALGNRVVCINRPEYIHFVQKVCLL